MNKKYIKRQLTLNELGIPMDDDIQKYYQYIYQYFDIENLIVKENSNEKLWATFGSIKTDILYDKNYSIFIIYKQNFIYDFTAKFNLEYNTIGPILILSILEYIFKEKVDDFQIGIDYSFI